MNLLLRGKEETSRNEQVLRIQVQINQPTGKKLTTVNLMELLSEMDPDIDDYSDAGSSGSNETADPSQMLDLEDLMAKGAGYDVDDEFIDDSAAVPKKKPKRSTKQRLRIKFTNFNVPTTPTTAKDGTLGTSVNNDKASDDPKSAVTSGTGVKAGPPVGTDGKSVTLFGTGSKVGAGANATIQMEEESSEDEDFDDDDDESKDSSSTSEYSSDDDDEDETHKQDESHKKDEKHKEGEGQKKDIGQKGVVTPSQKRSWVYKPASVASTSEKPKSSSSKLPKENLERNLDVIRISSSPEEVPQCKEGFKSTAGASSIPTGRPSTPSHTTLEPGTPSEASLRPTTLSQASRRPTTASALTGRPTTPSTATGRPTTPSVSTGWPTTPSSARRHNIPSEASKKSTTSSEVEGIPTTLSEADGRPTTPSHRLAEARKGSKTTLEAYKRPQPTPEASKRPQPTSEGSKRPHVISEAAKRPQPTLEAQQKPATPSGSGPVGLPPTGHHSAPIQISSDSSSSDSEGGAPVIRRMTGLPPNARKR
ncbi:unnamed protein product [Bursaphelenchus okinawaensis]|uniref:HUN domain-containing protein n=1 Tax=Bursaphelenchus okinawaensis TaxID=465554 RepID=A0A811JWX2_9BILA|nr:unnamed protein product [Bursaphelenchus okinawaensis]CAG9086274.1 unnamed protein product [Bursaphelenchus okinawaensis]